VVLVRARHGVWQRIGVDGGVAEDGRLCWRHVCHCEVLWWAPKVAFGGPQRQVRSRVFGVAGWPGVVLPWLQMFRMS
jgi:hypothetical protein